MEKEEIIPYLKEVVTNGEVVKDMLRPVKNRMGFERLYKYNGEHFLLSGAGENGFLTSIYPIKEKDVLRVMRRNYK